MALKWTPILRQCFVTSGVALNLGACGMVTGYTTGVLKQLQSVDSDIPIDEAIGSWLASIPILTMVIGTFMIPSLTSKYGRRTANFISIIPLFAGWVLIFFAKNVFMLIIARIIQGIGVGIHVSIASLLVGEYTSPKKRGVFLMSLNVFLSIGVLASHLLGTYMTWRKGAMISGIINLVNMVLVILSPESPSWLLDKERYEECKKAFRWLRGDDEELELTRMIEAKMSGEQKGNEKRNFISKMRKHCIYLKTIIVKKEFYMPTILMIHIYAVANWCGANVLTPYADELMRRLVDNQINVPIYVVTLDVHRIVANIITMFIVKQVKRRKLLITSVVLNVTAMLLLSAYSFAKEINFLPSYDSIGITLIHITMFAYSTGSLSLSYIISGEIFPLEYKNIAGPLTILLGSSLNMFVAVKIFSVTVNNYGIYGMFLINALVLIYCLVIIWIYLPETKDRTLQDIEDEIRGRKRTLEELKSVEPLKPEKGLEEDS